MSTAPVQSTAFPSIQVQGNVQGSIVFGDNNFVVNSNHGTIVYKASRPRITRHPFRPPPPRPPLLFLDRSSEVQQATRVISNQQPLALHGVAGIGKTTLLKQLAHILPTDQFPDGVVFVDGDWEALSLSGLDGVVQSVFEALFDSDPPLKVNLSTARTYLGSIQAMIMLDHLLLPPGDWQKLPDLIPAGGLIWTMLNNPPGQAAWALQLSSLPPKDSVKLFIKTAGLREEETDLTRLQQICKKLSHHPLAIVTFANWMRNENISMLGALERLNSQSIPGNNANELALAAIRTSLGEPEEEILSLVASANGPTLNRATLIQASSLDASQAESALGTLQITGLLQTVNQEVGLHPIYKTLTRRLLPANELQRTKLGEAILNHAIAHQRSPDVVRGQLGNLLGVLDHGLQTGNTNLSGMAARLATPHLVLSGKWDLWRDTFERTALAAELAGDHSQLARAYHELGTHKLAMGDQMEAIRLLTQARDTRLQNGDRIGAAYSQHNLNHLLGPPPPNQPNEPESGTNSSPRPARRYLGRFGMISILTLGIILGAIFLNGRASPANPVTPTSAVAMVDPTDSLEPLADPTKTPTSTPTDTPTQTLVPTDTYTPTPTPSATNTPTLTPTITPSNTSTYTPTPTSTHTPTFTPTPYPTPFGFLIFGSTRRDNNRELYLKRADGKRIDGKSVLRLTFFKFGNDNRPDLPPAGDRIAFTNNQGDNFDIFYTTGSTRSVISILPRTRGNDENHPDWSPAGDQLVYQSNKDGDSEIYIFDLSQGKDNRQLTNNNLRDYCPDWSPNGDRITYTSVRDNGNHEIYVMNADGTNKKNLTKHPADDRCPTWSPDGQRLAFLSNRSGKKELWIMNADGTNPWQLTKLSGVQGPGSWSPDGNWIAFHSNASGDNEIYIIPLDGRPEIPRTNNTSSDTFPVWVQQFNIRLPIESPG